MGEDIKGKFKKFNKEFKDYCDSKKSPAILLAVSKTKPLSQIVDLFEEGQKAFGENYAQELRDKDRENLNTTGKNLVWHFIGQIQKNKIKYIVGTSALIHTVDSYEKARLIDNLSKKNNLKQKILLQINISDDPKKTYQIAIDLEKFNKERQSIETLLSEKINFEVKKFDNHPVLVMSGNNWHEGIIGIVAARIKEKYNKPTVIITINKKNGIKPVTGSNHNVLKNLYQMELDDQK